MTRALTLRQVAAGCSRISGIIPARVVEALRRAPTDLGGGGGSVAEGFTCAVEKEEYRSACQELPKYSGSRYCVLHEPDLEKNKEDFLKVKNCKLEEKHYDFSGAVFPEGASNFGRRLFDADVRFAGATFHGKAAFSEAIFCGEANFCEATFKGEADFSAAKFRETGKEEAKEELRAREEVQEEAEKELKASKEALKKARKQDGRNAIGEAQEAAEQVTRAKEERDEAKRRVKEKRDTDFVKAVFEEEGDFKGAIFRGEANFGGATFKSEADFPKGTIFKGEARFRKATFERDVDFSKAIFRGKASFRRATFEGSVDFEEPDYSRRANGSKQYSFNERVDFSMAIFEKRARFIERRLFDTNLDSVTFRDALIEWPGNFSLDRVQLRPSWFIDTNVQGFRFTNVQWRGLRDGPQGSIEEEIEAIDKRRNSSREKEEEEDSQIGYPHDVLAKTCRELSANAEENHEYPRANEFHYWSMECRRKEGWSRLGLVAYLYWALSGYGERPRRAFLVLVGMWAFFALLYMVAGHKDLRVLSLSEVRYFAEYILTIWAQFILNIPLELSLPSLSAVRQSIADIAQALVYSLGALARLRPEPLPNEVGWFQFFVTTEGILGPLQIALLALAIRRKVMR